MEAAAKARGSKRRNLTRRKEQPPKAVSTDQLLRDPRALVEQARQQVAQAVNAGLVTLYWHVGAIRLAREQLARRAESPEAVPRLEPPSTSPRQRKKRR